jgi:hypothetical protein
MKPETVSVSQGRRSPDENRLHNLQHVLGKGHGTEPHLGTRSFPEVNSVLMIAFDQEEPLNKLVQELAEANSVIIRPDDKIRLFQVPLEKIL